jgi:hypothetical protein
VGRGKLSRPHGLPGCNSRPVDTTSKHSTLRHSHARLLCLSSTACCSTDYLPLSPHRIYSWRSWIRCRRHGLCCRRREEGGGEGALPRPHDLPGCHPHPVTSTPPPPSRPRASPLASWTPRPRPPLNRQRGVGGRRICAPTPTASPSPSTRSTATSPPKLPCAAMSRVAATTARRLGEQSRPLGLPGYPLIHCHRLCQLRAIEWTIGTGSDCLRCEEGEREATEATPTSQELRQPSHSLHRVRPQPPSSNPVASSQIRPYDTAMRHQPPRRPPLPDLATCAARRGEGEATEATPTSLALRQLPHRLHRVRTHPPSSDPAS